LRGSFYLNGHTFGFHPQTQNVEQLSFLTLNEQYHRKLLLNNITLQSGRAQEIRLPAK